MQRISNQALVIFLIASFILLIYLLAPILTPFLLGTLIAYLAAPLVKWLEKKWHIPHLISVILVFSCVFFLFLSIILMFVPLVQRQIVILIEQIPQIINWIESTLIPWIKETININTFKTTLSSALPKAGSVVNTVLKSSFTIIEWIVNIVLTPVVTFYLLRDWDPLLKAIKQALPTSIRPATITLTKECDEVLSAFFRGQFLVMLALCFIYGIGLTLVGLKVGLMIGLIGGILSIVPYLGSFFVLTAASLAAFVQFGTWHSLTLVLAVFLFGQVLESYILTPYLVGQRIGLHPVAVIFAVMAGGTLFGFFGVLLALPMAALIKVWLRFVSKHYRLT